MSFQEEVRRLREALKDLAFEVTKAIGLFRLIELTPFLELKTWVKERQSRWD